MELSEDDPSPPPDPGPLAKTVLVSIYKDGTETCKKLFSVNNASQLLQACHSEFSHPVQLERFLQYNNDFKDYIDCDTSTDVNDYDKFQVRVSTVIQLEFVEFQAPHVENVGDHFEGCPYCIGYIYIYIFVCFFVFFTQAHFS